MTSTPTQHTNSRPSHDRTTATIYSTHPPHPANAHPSRHSARHTHARAVRLLSVDGMLPESWFLSEYKLLQNMRAAIASGHRIRCCKPAPRRISPKGYQVPELLGEAARKLVLIPAQVPDRQGLSDSRSTQRDTHAAPVPHSRQSY
jgi:hypothetical protein